MTDGRKLDSGAAYPRNSARPDSRVPTKAKKLIAKSSIQINNTIDEAWKALVDPEIVAKYMLGSQQVSDLAERQQHHMEKRLQRQKV